MMWVWWEDCSLAGPRMKCNPRGTFSKQLVIRKYHHDIDRYDTMAMNFDSFPTVLITIRLIINIILSFFLFLLIVGSRFFIIASRFAVRVLHDC